MAMKRFIQYGFNYKDAQTIRIPVVVIKIMCAFFLLFFLLPGCDMFLEDIPPEELPPVPAECVGLLENYKNGLFGASKAGGASEMQVTRAANRFAECMQDEGLSRAQAKGIIKNQKELFINEMEEDRDYKQDFYVF